jgi:hypothetical protein
MPPLLCPSPVILDQSFPRDEDQLRLVGEALGEMESCLARDEAHLILTDILAEVVQGFDWIRTGPYPLLGVIFGLLNQWFLQPHNRLVRVDVSDIGDYEPHPVPLSAGNMGLVGFWADEVGRLLIVHDSCCNGRRFFIGVACESAFAGEQLGRYGDFAGRRVFPLVGPRELDQLDDAYDWDVPVEMQGRHVSFENAYRNCGALGAIRVDAPPNGSHYKVHFEGHRPWVLDRNLDPVPEAYLRELVSITGYDLPTVKYALLTGQLPPLVLRLERRGAVIRS